MSSTPTTDQLRSAIDSGATGEKIGAPDPATVPLGTDAEAGGSPPTAKERRLEAQSQTAPAPRHPPSGTVVYLLLLGAVALAVVAVLLLALPS